MLKSDKVKEVVFSLACRNLELTGLEKSGIDEQRSVNYVDTRYVDNFNNFVCRKVFGPLKVQNSVLHQSCWHDSSYVDRFLALRKCNIQSCIQQMPNTAVHLLYWQNTIYVDRLLTFCKCNIRSCINYVDKTPVFGQLNKQNNWR